MEVCVSPNWKHRKRGLSNGDGPAVDRVLLGIGLDEVEE
jgi:hypothetical protein